MNVLFQSKDEDGCCCSWYLSLVWAPFIFISTSLILFKLQLMLPVQRNVKFVSQEKLERLQETGFLWQNIIDTLERSQYHELCRWKIYWNMLWRQILQLNFSFFLFFFKCFFQNFPSFFNFLIQIFNFFIFL